MIIFINIFFSISFFWYVLAQDIFIMLYYRSAFSLSYNIAYITLLVVAFLIGLLFFYVIRKYLSQLEHWLLVFYFLVGSLSGILLFLYIYFSYGEIQIVIIITSLLAIVSLVITLIGKKIPIILIGIVIFACTLNYTGIRRMLNPSSSEGSGYTSDIYCFQTQTKKDFNCLYINWEKEWSNHYR